MKKLFFTSFLLILFGSSYAQTTDTDSVPHKNYKFIHIVSLDSNQVAYRSFGQFLTDKGSSISTGNIDFLSMTTQYAPLGLFDIDVSYQVTIKGHDIKITTYGKRNDGLTVGTGMMAVNMGTPMQLYYSESIMLRAKKVWYKIIGFLDQYPHSKIYYSLN